jgi:hypothetical protein
VTAHLTAEQRQLALRLKARGLSLREIGPQVGCSHQGVALIARQRPQRSVGPPGPLGARARAVDAGRPGGDHPRVACRTVLHRDRRPAGEGDLHGVAGGGRQRRPDPVPGVAGAPARPAAGQAAQDPEAGPCPAGRAGQQLASRMVVAAADLGSVADRVPRRSHDVGEPRNHLPGPVRAGPRRAAPGAGPPPADRAGKAPPGVVAWSTPASSGTR